MSYVSYTAHHPPNTSTSTGQLTRRVSASAEHNLAINSLLWSFWVCPVLDVAIARDFGDDRRGADNLEQRVGLWAHEEFDCRERR